MYSTPEGMLYRGKINSIKSPKAKERKEQDATYYAWTNVALVMGTSGVGLGRPS